MTKADRVLVVGLGNDYRSDDRVGLEAARQIERCRLPGLEVLVGVGDALEIIDRWGEAELVIVIDCIVAGRKPGRIYRFDGRREHIPQELFSRFSSHAFTVIDALALADALGIMPPRLVIYGIEAEHCRPGAELSPSVTQSLDLVVGRIQDELRRFTRERGE